MLRSLAFAFALAFVGCGSSDSHAPPDVLALYGTWANLDGNTNRVFVFSQQDARFPDLQGETNVYLLYLYNQGAHPLLVQRGRYDIVDGELRTTVLFDANNASSVGTTYADEFFDWLMSQHFVLHSGSAASGQRQYDYRADGELPL